MNYENKMIYILKDILISIKARSKVLSLVREADKEIKALKEGKGLSEETKELFKEKRSLALKEYNSTLDRNLDKYNQGGIA